MGYGYRNQARKQKKQPAKAFQDNRFCFSYRVRSFRSHPYKFKCSAVLFWSQILSTVYDEIDNWILVKSDSPDITSCYQ